MKEAFNMPCKNFGVNFWNFDTSVCVSVNTLGQNGCCVLCQIFVNADSLSTTLWVGCQITTVGWHMQGCRSAHTLQNDN